MSLRTGRMGNSLPMLHSDFCSLKFTHKKNLILHEKYEACANYLHAAPNKRSALRLNPRSHLEIYAADRYSGSRVVLLAAPSHPEGQWYLAAFVSDHSGGSATVSHRLPVSCCIYYSLVKNGTPCIISVDAVKKKFQEISQCR